MKVCIVCGDPRIHAHRRCATCYRFYHRHAGTDRPFELIAALTRRDIEREALADPGESPWRRARAG